MQRRLFSSAVKYSQYGSPLNVLKRQPIDSVAKAIGANDVHVKILAAPINPSDINQVCYYE